MSEAIAQYWAICDDIKIKSEQLRSLQSEVENKTAKAHKIRQDLMRDLYDSANSGIRISDEELDWLYEQEYSDNDEEFSEFMDWYWDYLNWMKYEASLNTQPAEGERHE